VSARKPSSGPARESATRESRAPSGGQRLYIASAILSLVGLVDALYLTIKHLTGQGVQCTVTMGCEEVLTSSYATVGGLPLAAFGAAAYFTVFSLATLALYRYHVARTLLFYLVAAMTLASLFLIYVQAFVIGKWCQFCLLSAAVTFCLMAIALAGRFFRAR
jgi:uncharacterized membrane protein